MPVVFFSYFFLLVYSIVFYLFFLLVFYVIYFSFFSFILWLHLRYDDFLPFFLCITFFSLILKYILNFSPLFTSALLNVPDPKKKKKFFLFRFLFLPFFRVLSPHSFSELSLLVFQCCRFFFFSYFFF